jgi:hypothetical protein
MSLLGLFSYIGKNSGKYRSTNVDAQTDGGASELTTRDCDMKNSGIIPATNDS